MLQHTHRTPTLHELRQESRLVASGALTAVSAPNMLLPRSPVLLVGCRELLVMYQVAIAAALPKMAPNPTLQAASSRGSSMERIHAAIAAT